MREPVKKPLSDDDIAEQAATWLVALSADDPVCKKALLAEFEQWQQADNRHKKSAQQIQSFINSVNAVNEATDSTHLAPKKNSLAANTINRALVSDRSSHFSSSLKVGALALFSTLVFTLGVNQFSPSVMMADIKTSTGEWQSYTLADGSQISLNSNSAVNIDFNNNQREITLLAGQVNIKVSKDIANKSSIRPFIVTTEHGSIEALGTEFIVSYRENSTQLSMLESKTRVKTKQQLPNSTNSDLVVTAGFSINITEHKLSDLVVIEPKFLTQAWDNQQLLVQDKPLTQVFEELNRHRSGHIFYDNQQLQHLRISAVLPLNDTEQALTLLMANYPQLTMRMLTPYAVFISHK